MPIDPSSQPSPQEVNYLLEAAVCLVYLLFLAAVGFVMKRFNTNSDDYFRSGARTTWWLMGPSLMMSMTSAAVFTATAGALFEAGLPVLATNFAQILTGIILASFLAAWFRQTRAITGPEIIRERFGPVTQQVFSYLSMAMQPVYGALQLLGLGIFVSAVFGFPLWMVVLVVGVVVGLYSVSGGRWAVMATDFLQSLTMYPVIILVTILCFVRLGGVGEFWEQAGNAGLLDLTQKEGTFPDNMYSLKWVIAVFAMQFVAQLQLGWASRFLSAKDGKEANKAALFMTLIGIMGVAFFVVPSFTARILYADQVAAYAGLISKPEEAAFVVACKNLVPAGLMGLVIVAMFSATASSMDTGLNNNSGVIVRNVVPPIRRIMKKQPFNGTQELQLARLVSIILCVFIIGLAFYFSVATDKGLFELLLAFGARVQFPIALPLLLALALKNAPRSCVLFSMGVGLIVPWLAEPVVQNFLGGTPLDFADRVVLVTFCSLSGFAFSYFFRRFETPAEREIVDDFNRKMRTPVIFSDEVGAGNDQDQLSTIGKLTLYLALGFFLLLLVPNDWVGRLLIFGMSAAVALVGLVLLLAAKRLKAKSTSGNGPD